MRRSKCLLVACVWCSLCCAQVTSAVADFYAPAGLAPGDTFHWVFVTSTTRDAVPTNIDPYNEFVNAVADAVAGTTDVLNVLGITELGDIDWRAIASAKDPAVDAKDNIGDPTSPIYRLDGALVANNEGDLFDNSIVNPIHLTETGTTYENQSVWTGSDWTGTTSQPLGGVMGGWSMLGLADDGITTGQWIFSGASGQIGSSRPLYAISPELTVVPLPGAVILGLLGLMSSSVVLAKRKRKHNPATDSTI